MAAALVLMTEKRFGCLGVRGADGALLGIVTDGDLRRAMGPDLLSRQVKDIMTLSPRTIGPDALAVEALHTMNAHDAAGNRSVRRGHRRATGRHPARARSAARGAGMRTAAPSAAAPGSRLQWPRLQWARSRTAA